MAATFPIPSLPSDTQANDRGTSMASAAGVTIGVQGAARTAQRTAWAAALAGGLFGVEGLASPFVEGEVAYHGINAPLSLALALACAGIWVLLHGAIGRTGRAGVYVTGLGAALAAGGGAVAMVQQVDAVEGLAHTAVLLSILGLVPLGIGLRRVAGVAGALVAASAGILVALVLAGADQPEVFLVPEVALGAALVGCAIRLGPDA